MTNHTSHYANVFKGWSKALGPRPTNEQLAVIHAFARPGKQAIVGAMALRDDGVTRAQMCQASALFDGKNTPHYNKWFGKGQGQATPAIGNFEPIAAAPGTYRMKLSSKGAKWVKAQVDGAAKPELKADGKVAETRAARKAAKRKAKAAKREAEKPHTTDTEALAELRHTEVPPVTDQPSQ
jgi:hypothetical protein